MAWMLHASRLEMKVELKQTWVCGWIWCRCLRQTIEILVYYFQQRL